VWLRRIRGLRQDFSRKVGFEHGQQAQPNCPWWADRVVYREAYLQGVGPSPETRNNHDYHSLITRAVAALNENKIAARQALYKRARVAQTVRLNNFDPALSMAEMDCECEALEHAIRLVEFEIATGGMKATRSPVITERRVREPAGGRREPAVPRPDEARFRPKQMGDELRPAGRSAVVTLRDHLRHRQRQSGIEGIAG
jgi:hypothetical protein